MGSTATIAIVATRLWKESRIIALSAAACALLAYLQRYDDPIGQFAGCLVFGTLTGIAVSMIQRGAGRFREIEVCEQSAPLYGRELARATALVPCIIVTIALAAYWAVAGSFSHASLAYAATCAPAVYAATLTALCATVRRGAARVLYLAVACALSAVAFVLALHVPVFGAAACALAGFIALRQYGEALARYDPV